VYTKKDEEWKIPSVKTDLKLANRGNLKKAHLSSRTKLYPGNIQGRIFDFLSDAFFEIVAFI